MIKNTVIMNNAQNEKISVIIPVHNGAKTLGQCLNSVLNQAYKNCEIIVVDNNSTDGSKEIIFDYKKKNNLIKYLYSPRRSRGAARNAGIRGASGSILVMTDCDCVVPPDWIEFIIKPIIHEREIIVMGWEDDLIKNYWTRNIQRENKNHIEKHREGKYIKCLDTKNFAIRAKVAKKIMFSETLEALEDFDFALRARSHGKIRFLPDVRVGHYHKSTFFSWLKIAFLRGYWTKKVYLKYKNNPDFINEPVFNFIREGKIINEIYTLFFPPRKLPLGKLYFNFITSAAKRTGMLLANL